MRYTMSDKDELTMPKDTKQHSQQFKEDAVRYVKEHPDITLEQCAQNRGMSMITMISLKTFRAAGAMT